MIYIWDNQIYCMERRYTYENILDTIKEIHVHMTKSFSNISHFPKHTSISYWISFQFSTKHMKPLCYNLFSSGLCMFYVHIFRKWKFCVCFEYDFLFQLKYNSILFSDDWHEIKDTVNDCVLILYQVHLLAYIQILISQL